jgi:hypothetical protein
LVGSKYRCRGGAEPHFGILYGGGESTVRDVSVQMVVVKVVQVRRVLRVVVISLLEWCRETRDGVGIETGTAAAIAVHTGL